MDIMSANPLQNDGYLFYYKFGLFRDKWHQIYYKLNSDCTFEWFYDKKITKPNGSLNLKDAVPNICIGPQTRLIPFKKPKLEKEWNQNQLIGIVQDKKVHYFYFKTVDSLKQLLSKIIHTFSSNNKETFTSSPYFSKNGKEIRVDHNITTIYNSLDKYLGLYGFGWHFWLQSNENEPVYGDFKNCHESNHSVQHNETNNRHTHNIDDKFNTSSNTDNNNRFNYQNNNNDFGVTSYTNNHSSTHNHGDFGCYNHSTKESAVVKDCNVNDFSSENYRNFGTGFINREDEGYNGTGELISSDVKR